MPLFWGLCRGQPGISSFDDVCKFFSDCKKFAALFSCLECVKSSQAKTRAPAGTNLPGSSLVVPLWQARAPAGTNLPTCRSFALVWGFILKTMCSVTDDEQKLMSNTKKFAAYRVEIAVLADEKCQVREWITPFKQRLLSVALCHYAVLCVEDKMQWQIFMLKRR